MSSDSPPNPVAIRRVSFQALHRFAREAFERVGMAGADAALGADVLATTDAWGVFTHGTKLLRSYLRRLKAGGLRVRGQPRVAAEGPAWALVDGDSSLGMVSSAFGMTAPPPRTTARRSSLSMRGP